MQEFTLYNYHLQLYLHLLFIWVQIKLCSSEYLVGMMGFYGPIEENSGFEAIRSVSFYTNKRKYGPFGTEIGTFFNSPAYTNAKVVGFHGRSGEYLDAIGVHVEYLSSSTHA